MNTATVGVFGVTLPCLMLSRAKQTAIRAASLDGQIEQTSGGWDLSGDSLQREPSYYYIMKEKKKRNSDMKKMLGFS